MESRKFDKEVEKKEGSEEVEKKEDSEKFEKLINTEIIKLMIFTFKNDRMFTNKRLTYDKTIDFNEIESSNGRLKNYLKKFSAINQFESDHLRYFLSDEEIEYLINLPHTILDILFDKFTEIMKEHLNKTVRLSQYHIDRTVSEDKLLRTNSITESIDNSKLKKNIDDLIVKINRRLNNNLKTREYTVYSDPNSPQIIIGILKSGFQIKHLTFHDIKSDNWRGSTHFRKEKIDPSDNFSGNAWYNNRLRFNSDDSKFKLDYDLDEIENTIINILNEDNDLINSILKFELKKKNLELRLKKLEEEKQKVFDEIKKAEAKRKSESESESKPDESKRQKKNEEYKNKYLKYKNKYLQLKEIYNTIR